MEYVYFTVISRALQANIKLVHCKFKGHQFFHFAFHCFYTHLSFCATCNTTSSTDHHYCPTLSTCICRTAFHMDISTLDTGPRCVEAYLYINAPCCASVLSSTHDDYVYRAYNTSTTVSGVAPAHPKCLAFH